MGLYDMLPCFPIYDVRNVSLVDSKLPSQLMLSRSSTVEGSYLSDVNNGELRKSVSFAFVVLSAPLVGIR